MTWTTFHRRGEILSAVIATVEARRDGRLPMDLAGVTETFGDELAVLGALQLRWHTRLSGQIERELMTQPMDLEQAVVIAWRTAAAAMPGVRAVLDHYRAEPRDAEMARVLATAVAKEHALLAVMAGRAGAFEDTAERSLAAGVGADIEQRARGGMRPTAGPNHRAEPGSFVRRIKAALAA